MRGAPNLDGAPRLYSRVDVIQRPDKL